MGAGEPLSEKEVVRYGRKIPLTEAERRTIAMERPITPKRGRGGRLLLALIVAAIVIVAIFWYMYMRPSGGNTPEEAFTGFIDALNAKDADELIKHTVLKFADDYIRQMEKSALEDMFASYSQIDITINSLQVLEYNEVAAEIREDLDDLVVEAEAALDVDIKDICIVESDITSILAGDEFATELPVPCVQIGSSWYVAVMPSIFTF